MERKGLGTLHGVIAVVLALIALLFGGNILIPLFGERGAFLGAVLIAIIGIAITLLTKTKLSDVFPMALPPIRQFFGSALMFIGVSFFSSALSVLTGRIFDAQARSNAINDILLGMPPLLAILLVAVLPAICEEFFCRGFLVKCFFKIKNEKALIALIGVSFGVLHLDLYTFVPTSLIGALLCFIAIRTKSLLVPMILHFANNAFSVVLTYISSSEQTSSAADLFSISISRALGMSLVYAGLALLPFFVGLRLFSGKKAFDFRTFVALLVSVVCMTVGSVMFALHSYDINTDTITVVDGIEEIPLDINGEGEYHFIAKFETEETVKISIVNGDEVLFSEIVKGSCTVNEIFEMNGSGYKLRFEYAGEEGNEEFTVVYTYVVLESVE